MFYNQRFLYLFEDFYNLIIIYYDKKIIEKAII